MLRKSKKLLSVVISLAILATMLSGFSVFAAGNTLTVGAGQTYSTIAAALAVATDGDTIYLVNGTYALPHTEIANNITIEGQSKAGVVLTPTAGTGSNKDVIAAGWLAVNTGGTLTVNNLTMDGSGQTVLVALWTIGALTVNNITIKNVKWADNLGTGIAVYRTGNLVATNVTMSNIGRLGIHAKAAATITGFSYTGKGVNNCLDYAMEIGTVATTVIPFTVNVTNATITDCLGVAYDGSGSAGIYVNTYFYSAQGGLTNLITANLSNINFYNCSTAFYSGYDETLGEYSNTTINNSNFINCEYDLAYYGKAGTGTVTTNGNFYGGAPVVDFSAGTTLTVGTPNIINKAFLNGTLYDTIAAAYAASVAGDTVYVGGTMDLNTNAGAGPAPLGGTVISALIVDKNITIMGTGIDPTITCSLINPNGTTVGVVSIYMKQGEIKNLTVKRPAGDGPNLVVSGVYLQGTAKITNCTVKNFRTGIEARGNNEIVGNTIESNRTGILYLSSDSITPIVKIINNTVIDNRTFGILFLDGGTYGGHPGRVYSTGYSFTIKGNEIYDNWFAELESRNVNAIDITNNFWGAQGPVLIHDYVNETLHPADGGSIISTKPGRPAGGIYQPTHSTSVTKSTNDAYKDFTAGVLTLDIVAPAVAQTLSVTDPNTNVVSTVTVTSAENIVPAGASLTVTPLDVENTEIVDAIAIAIQNEGSTAPVIAAAYEISLSSAGVEVQPNGNIQISLPIPAGQAGGKIMVLHILDDGTVEVLPATIVNGKAVFVTNSLSDFVLLTGNNVPVDFTTTSAIGKANSQVTVSVNIAANSASGTGTIVLPYNSAKLEVVSAAVGAALSGSVTEPPESNFMYSINTTSTATTLSYVKDSVGGLIAGGTILTVTYLIKPSVTDCVLSVAPSVTELTDSTTATNNLGYTISYGEIRVDNTAPGLATLSPSTTAPTNQNVTVTITYPGDAASKLYSYDNSIWSTYSAPLSIPANCTVYARSTDSAGNVSQVSSLVIANIDRVAPATPIIDVSTTSPTNQNVTVTITYTNTDNDISSREYSYDGIDWLPYTTTLSVGANCTVYAKSTDTASNFSTNQRNITNIDKVAPGVAILTASTTAPTNSLTVSIVYPTAFPGDSFLKQFSINGGSSWSTYGTAVPVSAAAVTVYAPINRTVSAQSQDEAGNWSAVTSLTLTNVVMLGDVNLGDNVSVVDALMSLHAASGKVPLTTANALYAADVNHSNTVTALDSLKILQFCSNKILGDYATVRPV